MLLPKNKRFEDPAYLRSFRDRECLIGNMDCQGDVVGAHFRMGWLSQEKPHDYLSLPLCWKHHNEQHRGERLFWQSVFMEEPLVMAKVIRMAAEFMYREWADG